VPPNALRRNGSECAAAFDYLQSLKIGVTKGLIQVDNLAERGPLATVGGPPAAIQKRTWEMVVNQMWIAILKPQITGKYSEKRKKQPTENLKNRPTKIEIAYSRIRLSRLWL